MTPCPSPSQETFVNPIDWIAHSMMIPILETFFQITRSYGWSIICLTVTIKLALFPLVAKQFRASRELQLLQPKMKALQEEYKDQPEVMQAKLMEFYAEHRVNPMGACLPTLIQMPFLFALYTALNNKAFQERIAHKAFFFIQNLADVGVLPNAGGESVHWANLVMVILFGGSMYVMQKMMTTNPDDPMQRQMMTMMPIMTTAMFLFFPLPSGILLYITASNLITMGQNFLLMRSSAIPAPIVPAAQAVIDTTPNRVDESSRGNKPRGNMGLVPPPNPEPKGD